MEWYQFVILVGTILGYTVTARLDLREHRSDMAKLDEKWEMNFREFREKWDRNQERWAAESKDFHGRLIEIEKQRNKFLFESRQ